MRGGTAPGCLWPIDFIPDKRHNHVNRGPGNQGVARDLRSVHSGLCVRTHGSRKYRYNFYYSFVRTGPFLPLVSRTRALAYDKSLEASPKITLKK